MKRFLKEAVGYTAASSCALMLDMVILWVLVHFLSWNYLAAATTSFLAGAVVAYELSVRLAFRQHRLQDQRVELLSFVALGAIGLGINTAVISAAVSYLGMHYLAAKCAAAGFTFACNFIMRRQLLFVRHLST